MYSTYTSNISNALCLSHCKMSYQLGSREFPIKCTQCVRARKLLSSMRLCPVLGDISILHICIFMIISEFYYPNSTQNLTITGQ